MPTVSPQDARNILTKTSIDLYREKPVVTQFLTSFFQTKEISTRFVSLEVVRGREKVAFDVARKSGGNLNVFNKSTEKVFDPPFFHEKFAMDELDLYNVALGSMNPAQMADLAAQVANNTEEIRNKVIRRIERMCSEALLTGEILVDADTNINFKRRAGSFIDVSGSNPWATGANSPYVDLQAAGTFLRKTGKVTGGRFVAIMGANSIADFLDNTTVTTRADLRRIALDDIQTPQVNAEGGVFHGRTSAGPYTFDIWSYDEFFEDENGVLTPYVTDEEVIIMPATPRFTVTFAAVPRVLGQAPQTGAFFMYETIDEELTSHFMHLKSAPIPILNAVDQVVTLTTGL